MGRDLGPYSAILPYRSFAFAMTKHSSTERGRLGDPAANRLWTFKLRIGRVYIDGYLDQHQIALLLISVIVLVAYDREKATPNFRYHAGHG